MGTPRKRVSFAIAVCVLALPALAAVLALAAACGGTGTASDSPSASASTSVVPSAAPSAGETPLPAPTVTGTIAVSKVTLSTGAFGELYSVNTDGTGLGLLATGEDVSLKQAAWSPDGTRIACIMGNSSSRPWSYYPYSLWTMNADGSGQARLTEGKVRGAWPTWSPDGKKLAFVRVLPSSDNAGIFVVDADGSGLERVTSGDLPVWTPGGDIYFVKGAAGDIFSIRPDGSGRARVTTDIAVGAFAVSRDGTRLAIYDSLGDSIVTLPADGSGSPTVLVDQVTAKGYTPEVSYRSVGVVLSWAPDGRSLAFAASDGMDTEGSALYIVNADGTGLSMVPGTGKVWDPAWRPE